MSGAKGHVSKVLGVMLRIAGCVLSAVLLTVPLSAQQTLDAETTGALRELAAQASIIFAGQVISVMHRGPRGVLDDAQGVVEITFRVDSAVRGAKDGQTYTLREWAGLWSGRSPRYVTGQRLLMLLATPRDGRGLASPVGGTDGIIPLEATASQPLLRAGRVPAESSAQTLVTSALTPNLRWIRARVSRTSTPQPSAPANVALGTVLTLLTQQSGAADAAR